ncbi:unnamed protein product [Pleuronectes platessa]|uniref:Uncharacterized protein n=1 Tax=Pleuronectes platessa TaxID=8262 RepID=A0A9N7Z2F0_PLEPL|nr:unnamed protein product [Pleuronectes platessa]
MDSAEASDSGQNRPLRFEVLDQQQTDTKLCRSLDPEPSCSCTNTEPESSCSEGILGCDWPNRAEQRGKEEDEEEEEEEEKEEEEKEEEEEEEEEEGVQKDNPVL